MIDLYASVPKALEENLRYRRKLRARASQDSGFRRAMLAGSKHDFLFWLNAFAWLYEPRTRFGSEGKQLPKFIPFITWPHQDTVIREIRKYLGSRDLGIEKSRGEGMSWIGVLLALHDWLFDPGAKIGLVSNTEKKADDPGNMDSLMAKLDWELTKLPLWMAGEKDKDFKRNMADHSLVNLRNFSQINAFAATSDAGRGGRYKWFLPDELAFWERTKDSPFMASIRGSTDCRLVVSTPNGTDGEYYSYMHTPSNVIRLTLDWKDNPTRNRGLYELKNNRPVAVSADNPLPKEYELPTAATKDLFSRLRLKGFRLEGKLRSPWYDNECDRADSNPHSIAQELDRDYGGSMFKIFGNDFMDKAASGVRPATIRGLLNYNPETLQPDFDTSPDGQLHLWCPLDVKKLPPKHSYVIGADISSGLGGSWSSNSAICVVDMQTMEQVAEYALNTMPLADFADYAIALAKWFHNAYLIWEHNGPGAGFTKRVLDRHYGNIYRRKNQYKGSSRRSTDAGWMTTRETKESMFSAIYHAVKSCELTLRSSALVRECGQYIRINGKIEHVLAMNTADDSSKGLAHGDRVIACAVCWQGVKDRPLCANAKVESLSDNPPYGTLAWRERLHKEKLNEDRDQWDMRTNDDLAAGTAEGILFEPDAVGML